MGQSRVLLLLAGLGAVSCQTITEEMPTASHAPVAPVPVIIVQGPTGSTIVPVVPTTPPVAANPTTPPAAANPTTPPSAPPPPVLSPFVGVVVGGGPTTPPVPPVAAAPTTAPTSVPPLLVPTTAPPPAGNNGSGGGGGGCGGITNNCNAVASVHAYVYYVVCGTSVVDAKFAEEGPSGCDVRLDATPKDANGKATEAHGTPHWDISGASWDANANKNPYTPLVYGGNGSFTASVEIDGVRSNTFTYRFR